MPSGVNDPILFPDCEEYVQETEEANGNSGDHVGPHVDFPPDSEVPTRKNLDHPQWPPCHP